MRTSAGRYQRYARTRTISQDLCALGNIYRPTESNIGQATLVVDHRHSSWFVNIASSKFVVDFPHRLCLVNISHSLSGVGFAHGSGEFAMVWVHRSCDISCVRHVLTLCHRPTTCYNNQCLHVSILECTHPLDDTFVDYLHLLGDISEQQVASAKVLRIERCLYPFGEQHKKKTCIIVQGYACITRGECVSSL